MTAKRRYSLSARAVQYAEVSRQLFREADNPMVLVDLPPVDWFVRGPMGGLYEATGERERYVTETSDGFMRNTVAIVDKSQGVRYLRPGTKRHAEASEALK